MEPVVEFDPPLQVCRLCGSQDVRPFDRDYRGNRIDRCPHCGVKFLNPQYSDAHLERFYAGYINFHPTPNSKQKITNHKLPEVRLEGKRRSLELVGRFVERGPLLSIGSGDGLEIKVAKELGWEVEGYDVSSEVTAKVAREFGIPVHSGDFLALDLPADRYAAVFMDQVLEHLKDPSAYLRRVHRLLRPGGVLFIGVPNIGSLANQAKTLVGRLGLRRRRRGRHYASQHHIFYFSPPVLRRILERFGFEVLTLRGSLKPQKNPITPRLSGWFPNLDSGFLAVARKAGPGSGDDR